MQDAIYLYFTVGFTLTAVLWMIASSGTLVRGAWAGLTGLLTAVALACHAAQPYTRTNVEALEGHRTVTLVEDAAMERCSLRLAPRELEPYKRLVAVIQRDVPEQEPIAALPSDAELYFLANRPNPFKFYNSAIGVRTPTAIRDTVKLILREAPRIMTFRPDDKYNTAASRAIIEQVQSHYDRIDSIAGLEVYRLKTR